MNPVFLGLGANVGDRKDNILKAIELLKRHVSITKVAPIYETKAFGYTEQANFYNTALVGTTALDPEKLLHFVKTVEKNSGRIKRFRWGPREIDIDILFYGDLILKTPTLEIPHPGIPERFFVLKPLSDIAPDLMHPVLKQTVTKLLSRLPVGLAEN